MIRQILAGACALVAAFGVAAAQDGPAIDHVVYAVPDLATGAAEAAEALGVAPTTGGSHPGRGTANVLVSLGGRTYLEIFGPDPEQTDQVEAQARLTGLERPEVLTFAVAASDLAGIKAKAQAAGLETSEIEPGSRRTPSGDLLEWRALMTASEDYAGLVPFFIDWGESAHPGTTSAEGATLKHVHVLHPEPQGLQEIYAALGVEVSVHYGNRPTILVEIEGTKGEVFLLGEGAGF